MEQVVKTYLGLFLSFIAVFVAAGIISGSISASNAVSFHADAIRQIEDSNFAPSVINAVTSDAEEGGYILYVRPITNANTGRITMAEVIIEYDYKIPFLGIEKKYQKRGFAR